MLKRILDHYDGARMRVCHRVKTYRVLYSDGTSANAQFSEAQALDFGASFEPDGVRLDVAIRMVDKWNAMAKRQGNSLRYAIPFVKSRS